MGKILEHVYDPGWWFTAIFIGFIVNILAGLLQSPIDTYLSQISSRARKWRARREELLETRACFIAEDNNLILLYLLKGLALIIIELFVTGVFVGSYLMYRLLGSEEGMRIPSIIVMMLSGFLAIKIYYRAIYRFKCANRAEELYLANKSKPPPTA
jgi:hypothetical protein